MDDGGITEEELREAGVTIVEDDFEEARGDQGRQGHHREGGTSQSEAKRPVEDNDEPTDEEVLDYAVFLGLDPEADAELMYLARVGLKASIEGGWKTYQNQEGRIFYFNFKTGVSSWDHPADETSLNMVREKKREKLLARPKKSLNSVEAEGGEKHDDNNYRQAFAVKEEPWWPGYRQSVLAAMRNAIAKHAEHVVIIGVRSDAALGSATEEYPAMLQEIRSCYAEKVEPFFSGYGSVKKFDWENLSALVLSWKLLEKTLVQITGEQNSRAIIVSVSELAMDAVIEIVQQHNRRDGVTEVDVAWVAKDDTSRNFSRSPPAAPPSDSSSSSPLAWPHA